MRYRHPENPETFKRLLQWLWHLLAILIRHIGMQNILSTMVSPDLNMVYLCLTLDSEATSGANSEAESLTIIYVPASVNRLLFNIT